MGVLQGLVANSGYLYAAWKSKPDDDRIFYSRWNGQGSWSPASPMASNSVSGNTSAGPSLGVLGGKTLYAAWKGEWSDPRLFFAQFGSSGWEAQVQIPNAYSDVGPALCGFGTSQLVLAWKSIDQSLWYAVWNGSSWTTTPTQIPGVASSVGPSLASHGGLIYAAWKGGGDQSLWWATFNGSWSTQTKIPGVASSVGPALASLGSRLYAIWKGEGTDQRLWWSYYDPTTKTWSTQAAIPNTGSSVGAAIAEFNGNLYAFWKGEGSDVRLYNATLNKSTWSTPATDIPGTTGPDPTSLMPPPPGGGINYVLSDSKGADLTGLTVAITITEDLVSHVRTDGTYRYGFQINCHSAKDSAHPEKFVWQQFFFDVDTDTSGQNAQLSWWVNGFLPNDPGTDPTLGSPRTRLAGLASSRLLKGSQLTMTLTTDSHNNNVTGVTFSFTPPNGPAVSSGLLNLTSLSTKVTSANLAPIVDVQAILSGEFNGQQTVFSSAQGIFLYVATNSLVAGAGQGESAEGSNVKYSALPASYPNGEFFQFFGFPDA
jgi:hypothetical protein